MTHRREKYLVVAAVRFIRTLISRNDVMMTHIVKNNLLKPIVDALAVMAIVIICSIMLFLNFLSILEREYQEHVKDLSGISKDLCPMVIVDNNPFSFLVQPMNGIPRIPFSAGQPHDAQLLEVILPLLKHLSQQKDIRPVLYERFYMPKWFQKHGIPVSGWTSYERMLNK